MCALQKFDYRIRQPLPGAKEKPGARPGFFDDANGLSF
jgi:hypothetical protein